MQAIMLSAGDCYVERQNAAKYTARPAKRIDNNAFCDGRTLRRCTNG
jgi:hypothetical protein